MKPPKSVQKEITNILASKLKDKVNIVINSPKTKEILEALPAYETYFLVKESWGGDSQILLQYMPTEKICNFIDIECWDKDVLSIGSLIQWLVALMEAGISTFIEALDTLDLELIVLMFQSFIEVVQISPTDDNAADIIDAGFESLDNMYYFRYLDDREENQIIKTFLDITFSYKQELYYVVMQGICWELKSALEEAAFERRETRLIELGFPPPTDSLSIYQYIKPEKLISKGIDKTKIPHIHETDYLPSLYKDQISEGTTLISSALVGVDDNTKERLLWEMAYLTNKIIVTDYCPIDDIERISESIRKALSLTSLGLDFLLREKGKHATSILNEANAETLFSLGYNLVIEQQRRLKTIINNTDLNMIPDRDRTLVEGLLKKRPLYQDKEFSSVEELDTLTDVIDRIGAMASLMGYLGWKDHIKDLVNTNIGSIHGLDMENVILTAMGVNLIEKKTGFRPLLIEEAVKFINNTTYRDANGYRTLKPGFHEDLNILLQSIDPSIEGRLIKETADGLEDRFITEISGIKTIESIDPRFITCLVVRFRD
ncbi:MAG: hypothetical protein J7L53_10580 [Deltaproteobacteria bacterium]|nr:hypothetical protein [Deltaproteobacteria bacterium]